MIRFTVCGAPRTKKTSNRLVHAGGRARVLPSKAWTKWTKTAFIGTQYSRDVAFRVTEVADRPYNCRAIFYRDAKRGDAVGYYQGLADLLEKRGIISNDKWLVSWDGSRLEIDRDNPRVEVELTPFTVASVA